MTASANRFEVDLERRVLKIAFGAPREDMDGVREVAVQFRTTNPEFHLGLIALVARELRKKSSLHEPISMEDIAEEVEILNLAPALQNRSTKVSDFKPHAALRHYFSKGMRLSKKEHIIKINGRHLQPDEKLHPIIEKGLRLALVAQGSDQKPADVRLDMRGLSSLGIEPAHIATSVDQQIVLCLSRIRQAAAKHPGLRTLTRDECELLDGCRELGIRWVQEDGIIPDTTPFADANDICILAFSAVGLVKRIDRQLSAALRRGARIRVILADSKSELLGPSMKLTFRTEDIKALIHEIELTEQRLRRVVAWAEEGGDVDHAKLGTLELARWTTEFRSFLAIRDGRWGWFTPHLPPKESKDTPSMELTAGKLLSDCLAYFEAVWGELKKANRVEVLSGGRQVSRREAGLSQPS